MSNLWDSFKRDVRKAKDDFDESRRNDAAKFSDKVFRKNRRKNPDAEWVYAETQSRSEMRQLLAHGWEVVTTSQKATAIGSTASVFLLRKKNEDI